MKGKKDKSAWRSSMLAFLSDNKKKLKKNVHFNKIKTNMKANRIHTKSNKVHCPHTIPYFFFSPRWSSKDANSLHTTRFFWSWLLHFLVLWALLIVDKKILIAAIKEQDDKQRNKKKKVDASWNKKKTITTIPRIVSRIL